MRIGRLIYRILLLFIPPSRYTDVVCSNRRNNMTVVVEAIYENGTLKLDRALPLNDKQRVTVTVHAESDRIKKSYGMVPWNGSDEDLEYLINDPGNSPSER